MISEELVIAISSIAIILSVISLLGNYYLDRVLEMIDKREKEI